MSSAKRRASGAQSMPSESSFLAEYRVSRAEALARELEMEIVDGPLPSGHRLGTKIELRERFGVAVATVNEAVRMLETRGLIVARPGPGGGVFVASPSARVRLSHLLLGFKWGTSTLSDCLSVRATLEPMLLREVGRYRRQSDLKAFGRELQRMEENVDDPPGYLSAAWGLHRRMAKVCRNAPLKAIYLTLLDYVEEGLAEVEPLNFDGPRDLEIHRTLISALASQDGRRIDDAIALHATTLVSNGD